jgi:hypothetical protein
MILSWSFRQLKKANYRKIFQDVNLPSTHFPRSELDVFFASFLPLVDMIICFVFCFYFSSLMYFSSFFIFNLDLFNRSSGSKTIILIVVAFHIIILWMPEEARIPVVCRREKIKDLRCVCVPVLCCAVMCCVCVCVCVCVC